MAIADLFQAIFTGAGLQALDQEFPFYPLTSPGMPLPGESFLAAAQSQGDPAVEIEGSGANKRLVSHGPFLQYLYRRALYDADFSLPVQVRGQRRMADLVPGHLLGSDTANFAGGPRLADVFLIGKNPGHDEVRLRRNFVGPTSGVLFDALSELGVSDVEWSRWYATNLVRWPQLDAQSDGIPISHRKDCAIFLEQELRLVRPRYVLCLGSDASKALLGTEYGVKSLVGRVLDKQLVTSAPGQASPLHRLRVMGLTHPAQVWRHPELYDEFKNQLGLFISLINGADIGNREKGLRHVNVYTARALAAIVEEIRNDPDPMRRILAIDGEWEGAYPAEPGAYLRTVQFSSKHGEGITVVLRHQGGSPAFVPSIADAVRLLNRLFKTDAAAGWYPRIGGHFLRADLPWLIHAGIDVRDEYAPAEKIEDLRAKGGFETGLQYHAVNEAASYRLTDMEIRLTTVPVYDGPVKEAITDYCRQHDIGKDDLEGFGFLPDWVLHPDYIYPGAVEHSYACLHGGSLVQLADGSWKRIRELVRDKYAGCVKAYSDGGVVDAPVVGWHRSEARQQEWFRIRTEGAIFGKHGLLGPVFTPDHRVLTQRGKVRVDSLVPQQDGVLTEEPAFNSEQLSVFLGSLLGDGGFTRKNGAGVGFGFSQRAGKLGYLQWKAAVFAAWLPQFRRREYPRYETPFMRYFSHLAQRFPTHPVAKHGSRKAVITPELLENLGDLGLAVWYQDDGTLVRRSYDGVPGSCRIYATLPGDEAALVVAWLTRRVGRGVTYNQRSRFIQFGRGAVEALHERICPYMHPEMGYKTWLPVVAAYRTDTSRLSYYDPVREVVPQRYSGAHRGNGVRYCLTVEGAGNFLTKAGFVSNCYDPDGTRRIAIKCMEPGGLLDKDWYDQPSWEPYFLGHRASLGVLQMEMEGIALDKGRMDKLALLYLNAYEALLASFRQHINWPAFNPKSHPQCRAVLFGDRYAVRVDKATGQATPIRPETAVTLNLPPLKTTGKRSKLWADVMSRGEEGAYTPSTDKEVLGIVGHQHRLAMQLRDLRFIAQTLSGALRRPTLTEDEEDFVLDENDNMVYADGIAPWVHKDGKIRTHVSQNKETGRYATARPPLQNLASRREDDYARILGVYDGEGKPKGDYLDIFPSPLYCHPVRSIFCADPGYIMLEADLSMAEVAMLAWLSDDLKMIDYVRRGALDKSDPDYYEIHSQTAVQVFRLNCEPTKKGLSKAGYNSLRTAAKNVRFGIPYGRQAEAISRQCREEGVHASPEDCQRIVDFWHYEHPQATAFLAECRARSQNPRWLSTLYGRKRRFIRSSDRSVIGEQERQAQNFPIQGGVADAVQTAIYNFCCYQRQHPDAGFRMLLQNHDALLFKVPISEVSHFINTVLPLCMIEQVPIWPRFLDGRPMSVSAPYYFSIETKLNLNWGESITVEDAKRIGLRLDIPVATARRFGVDEKLLLSA